MPGLAARLEDWLLALQRDRPRMARYMQIAWWIANAVLFLGIVLIVFSYLGVLRR